MARVEIYETVINTSGVPVSGETVHVYDARTTNHATVYSAETGPTTLSNPLTTSNGNISGWVDEGEYDLTLVTAGTTQRFNAIVGGNPTLGALAIDTTDIADDAVTAAKIAAGAVGSSEIAADAVGSSEIATDAVTATEIAADSVGSSELQADSVTTTELAIDAVTTENIIDDAITAPLVADDAIDTAQIQNDAITTPLILNGAVTADKIDLPAVQSDSCDANAAGTFTLGSWVGTGANLTLSANGLYLIIASGYAADNVSSSGVIHYRSSVIVTLTATDSTRLSVYTDAGADALLPCKNFFPLAVTSQPISLAHAIWAEDTVGIETAAAAIRLYAIRLSGA